VGTREVIPSGNTEGDCEGYSVLALGSVEVSEVYTGANGDGNGAVTRQECPKYRPQANFGTHFHTPIFYDTRIISKTTVAKKNN
jgi:hypothetical protein